MSVILKLMSDVDLKIYYRQFQKIKLWNDIGNQIIYFGMQYGNPNLSDFVDMNCGGIPEGDFEQVVDVTAPQQFISMYNQIAQKRLTYTVRTLINANKDFLPPIKDFCHRVGKDLKLSGIDSLEKAKEVMEDFIFENSEDNGDRPLLLELESYFLNGLFEASNIQVEITEKETLNILWHS